MRPPSMRSPDEWRRFAEDKLGLWWERWEEPLQRHDALLPTLAAGDNLALLAKQMGTGRAQWLARALVDADMWDRHVVVLCPPALQLYWHQTLTQAGMAAENVTTLSAWQMSSPKTRARSPYYINAKLRSADVFIIEPPCRPGTKLFAALAQMIRDRGRTTQIVTTTTMVWGAQLSPPRYVDSCLKLLGYLDAPEDIRVCWTEDCVEAARV